MAILPPVAALQGHWEKRNPADMENYNPANLDIGINPGFFNGAAVEQAVAAHLAAKGA